MIYFGLATKFIKYIKTDIKTLIKNIKSVSCSQVETHSLLIKTFSGIEFGFLAKLLIQSRKLFESSLGTDHRNSNVPNPVGKNKLPEYNTFFTKKIDNKIEIKIKNLIVLYNKIFFL